MNFSCKGEIKLDHMKWDDYFSTFQNSKPCTAPKAGYY